MSLLQGCWQCSFPAFPLRFPTAAQPTFAENTYNVKSQGAARPARQPLSSICPVMKKRKGGGSRALKVDLSGHWSVSVNGNWRRTFAFENGDAILVDYQDYQRVMPG